MMDAKTLHEWREIARIARGFGEALGDQVPDVKDIRVLHALGVAPEHLNIVARAMEKALAFAEEGRNEHQLLQAKETDCRD